LRVQDGEIAVYRPVTQRIFPLNTESHRWGTGCHPVYVTWSSALCV